MAVSCTPSSDHNSGDATGIIDLARPSTIQDTKYRSMLHSVHHHTCAPSLHYITVAIQNTALSLQSELIGTKYHDGSKAHLHFV